MLGLTLLRKEETMRRMSFMLTGPQMRDKSKTVTRRLGWRFAKPGMVVLAVSQCQGLKPGQKATIYGPIKIISTRWERLDEMLDYKYGDIEATKEGFPELGGGGFVRMFCEHMKTHIAPQLYVNRIEFEHLTA